jgi:hypothetical protein
MPDLDPAEVLIGTANGVGLWVAPPNTPPPPDLETAFATPWLPLGYADAAGVTIGGTTTTENIIPWQSKMPIRTVVTAREKTLHFVLWQLNEITLGMYFDTPPPAPSGDGSISFDVMSDAPQQEHAVSVDVLDGTNRFRLTYPRANLSTTGDMVLSKSAVVPLDITLAALDAGGVLAHIDTLAVATAAPLVTTEPSSQSVAAGGDATFTSAASGGATAQWQSSTDSGATFNNIPGATSGTYTKTAVTVGDDQSQYQCVWTNSLGTVTSTAATLTVT